MGLGHSPAVVSEGLVFYFDPINTRSYAGTGLTGFNLIDTSIVGSLVGGAVYDVANKGSIYFDGVDDYIDFGSSTIFKLLDNFTLSAWVKSSVYGDRAILGNFGPSSDYSGFNLNIQPSNKFAFLTGSAATATYLYSNDTFLLNKWYHLTAVRQNGTNYLYVNGVGQSSTNSQVVKYSNQNFYFAKWYSNLTGFYHNGNIASAAFYNKALSSTEILQNYNATKKRFSPEENIVRDNLILNLDAGINMSYPGTGTSWFEISGSGSTATLISATFSSTNGGAFVFNGTSSYASLPTENRFDLSTGSATISAWFKTASSGLNCIASKRNGTGFQFYVLNAKLYADGAGTAGASSSQSVNTGNNFYGAVVYDRANSLMRLYVNGAQDGSVALASTTLTDTADVNVGRKTLSGAGDYFNGTIYQVQIYNKALSSTEILQNYNALKGRYGLS